MTSEAYAHIAKGLTMVKDVGIREELFEAMGEFLKLRQLDEKAASQSYNYRTQLRARSVEYIVDAGSRYSKAVPFATATEFMNGYERSIKGFAAAEVRIRIGQNQQVDREFLNAVKQDTVPLIASAGDGSLRLLVGNNFISHGTETKELIAIRDELTDRFNKEIVANDFSDDSVSQLLTRYTDEERREILQPIIKIRSNRSDYRVSYKSRTSTKVQLLARVKPSVKKRLLPSVQPSEDVKQEIAQHIILKKTTGSQTRNHMLKETKHKHFRFDLDLNELNLPKAGALVLTSAVTVNIEFDHEDGWSVAVEELDLEGTGTELESAMQALIIKVEQRIRALNYKVEKHLVGELEEPQLVLAP